MEVVCDITAPIHRERQIPWVPLAPGTRRPLKNTPNGAERCFVTEKSKPGVSRGRKATGPYGLAGLPDNKGIIMRSKKKRFLAAFAVAGMIAASTSAFTAANTGVDDAYVGYDSATISGVTVSNVAYNVDESDASKLSSIVFTEAEDVSTGYDAILTINGPTEAQIACTATYDGVESVGTIDCPTTANVADVVSIALTVSAN